MAGSRLAATASAESTTTAALPLEVFKVVSSGRAKLAAMALSLGERIVKTPNGVEKPALYEGSKDE
jgi:hypothetical protein